MTRDIDGANRHGYINAGLLNSDHIGKSIWAIESVIDGDEFWCWRKIAHIEHTTNGVRITHLSRGDVPITLAVSPAQMVDVTTH